MNVRNLIYARPLITLPLFYLRRLEFLLSFKGTFEFDLKINVNFSCKLEFVCENWNFFFENQKLFAFKHRSF